MFKNIFFKYVLVCRQVRYRIIIDVSEISIKQWKVLRLLFIYSKVFLLL
jgi:hypothetical protein